MKFTPKSNDQIKKEMLIPAGDYDFEVVKAEEKVSTSGNPMIALNLKVFTTDGGHRFCNDWLMTTHPSLEYKFRHFCEGTGLEALYESGDVGAGDIQGRSGRCSIVVKDDKSGQYGPQNSVKDYLLPTGEPSKPAPVLAAAKAPAEARPSVGFHVKPVGFMDPDDIPF